MLPLPLSLATAALSLSSGWAPDVALFPPGEVPGEVPGAIGPEYWVNKTTQNGYVARQLRASNSLDDSLEHGRPGEGPQHLVRQAAARRSRLNDHGDR